jgi:putative ABC transport system permease protein
VKMVISDRPGVENEASLVRSLREVYTAAGMKPAFLTSASEIRRQNKTQFDLLTNLMLAMAILAGVVGSIGLMGTMSINVVERVREIGVMRAIGAGSLTIIFIFIAEGVFVGLLSWLLALPFSYPGAQLFSEVVGNTLFKIPLGFKYSLHAAASWLGIVVALSIFASLWPALGATRISVRQALAYE